MRAQKGSWTTRQGAKGLSVNRVRPRAWRRASRVGVRAPKGSGRVALWAEAGSRRPDDPMLVAWGGGPTWKTPGPEATLRAAAPGALRFVAARRRCPGIASSPRLAVHPQAQAARQRSLGVRTPRRPTDDRVVPFLGRPTKSCEARRQRPAGLRRGHVPCVKRLLGAPSMGGISDPPNGGERKRGAKPPS